MFSWYKYLIVSLVFSHLGFWSGRFFLIAPFPDLCLLVPFSNVSSDSTHSIQVGSISALLNFCRLVCSTYDPHRNFSFEGNLVLSFTACVSNCRIGCIMNMQVSASNQPKTFRFPQRTFGVRKSFQLFSFDIRAWLYYAESKDLPFCNYFSNLNCLNFGQQKRSKFVPQHAPRTRLQAQFYQNFIGGDPRTPLRKEGNPSRAFPFSCLRHSTMSSAGPLFKTRRCRQTGVRVSIFRYSIPIYRDTVHIQKYICFQSMCIALMLRKVNSQTNVKIDINYAIDIQNMPEHNNNKELCIFVYESDIFVN